MIEYLTIAGQTLSDSDNRGVTKVSGLIGIPSVRGTSYLRPENDGATPISTQYLNPRIITIDGECWGSTLPLVFADFRTLCGVLEAGGSSDLLLKWRSAVSGVDMQANTRLIGEVAPTITSDQYGPVLSYQLQLQASDPRAYSQVLQSVSAGASVVTTGGLPLPIPFPLVFFTSSSYGVTATNAGNTQSWPTFTITGPINGPIITAIDQAKDLRFPGLSLGASDTLVITTNPLSRSAIVNGSVSALGSFDFAGSGDWFALRGLTAERLALSGPGSTASTAITVSWRDAYTG